MRSLPGSLRFRETNISKRQWLRRRLYRKSSQNALPLSPNPIRSLTPSFQIMVLAEASMSQTSTKPEFDSLYSIPEPQVVEEFKRVVEETVVEQIEEKPINC
uniref:(northern house mosquito) hypothetical protein n=1 Tax=Culex pipiens TaxID=7175 RepID=A0A8D8B9V1_CULPI